MSNYIEINTSNITQQINKIKIDVPFIVLNSSCIVRVLCYDNNFNLIKTYEFELSGEDYTNWNTDGWLINYVLNKYNFSLNNI